MRSQQASRITVVLVMAGLLLGGLWMFLPDCGQSVMASAPAAAPGLVVSAQQIPDLDTGQPSEPGTEWLALVRAAQTGAASLLSGPITIHMDMTGGYVAGRVPTGLPVTIEILREGELEADITVPPVPDPGGFFYYGRPIRGGGGDPCTGGCSPDLMSPGDEVRVTQASLVLTMTVPSLSALADSSADQVYGEAPSFSELDVYLYPESPAGAVYTQTVVADSQGAYMAGWSPGLDIRPKDTGYSVYAQDLDRQAYVRFVVPFLRMQVGADNISGLAAPNTWVAITITTGSGAILDLRWGYTGEDGRFGAISEGGANPVRLAPGYHVLASAGGQAFAATVGDLSAQSDLQGNVVSGRATPGSAVEVTRYAGPLTSSYDEMWFQPPVEIVTAVVSLPGDYQANLALAPGNYGAAVWTGPQGHQTYARYVVPQHHILLGDPLGFGFSQLWGQVDAPGQAFTVEVKGQSGYLKDLILGTAADNGAYMYATGIWPPSYLLIESGDRITITTPNRVEFSHVLPALTAVADANNGTVSGIAPPNAVLTVGLNRGWLWTGSPVGDTTQGGGGGGGPIFDLSLVVTATAQGTYLADFSSLGGFDPLTFGEVELALGEGHTAARPFLGLAACPPTPYRVQIGLNSIQLYGVPGCMAGQLRLLDGQGGLKAETSFFSEYFYAYLELSDDNGHPILIYPGDVIEVEAGGSLVSEVVPELTVSTDFILNQVSGVAPAGQELQMLIWERSYPFGYHTFTTTTTAQGHYLVDLNGILTLSGGDQVDVSTWYELPIYARTTIIPFLSADLSGDTLYGELSPLTPYTLTSLAPGGPLTTTTGLSAIDGSFFAYFPSILPGMTLDLTTPDQFWPMTIPTLTMEFDQAAGIITGGAPPSTTLTLEIWDQVSYASLYLHTTADENGVFVFDHPALIFFEEPLGTLHNYDSLGNETLLRIAPFAWHIWIGMTCVDGVGASGSAQAELTMESPDGLYQEVVPATISSYDGSFFGCFQRAVQGGSRLTFDDGLRVREFEVPMLTVGYHGLEQVLVGTAPPNAMVEVEMALKNYQFATRHVQANGQGVFGLDISDLPLDPWGQGVVSYQDRQRNLVFYSFRQAYQAFLPWAAANE